MDPAKFRFSGFNTETVKGVARSVKKQLKGYGVGRFLLGCTFQGALSDEARMLLKKEFQPVLVKEMEKALKAEADFENAEAEIIVNFNQDLAFLYVKPVFVAGRYRKLSRKVTQTVHYCFECKGRGCKECGGTGIITKESVQSLVEKHALPLLGARSAKFHGSGREDKDVRMLGNGRKFVLEIAEPKKRKADLKKMQAQINKKEKGKIEVMGLKYSSKREVMEIKAERSDKLYEALIYCEKNPGKEVKELKGKTLAVKQRTPERVEASRADAARERKAEITGIGLVSGKGFRLQVKAESGLYIKEFVSGDSGRTKPSISSLLENKCEVKELDVLKIIQKP